MRLLLVFAFISFGFLAFSQTKTVHFYVEKGKNGKFGLIDAEKMVHVPFKYDAIVKKRCDYSENHYFMSKADSLYGIIDFTGRIIKEPEYDTIKLISQSRDWIITEQNNLVGMAIFIQSDKENEGSVKELIKPQYDSIYYPAGEGMATGFVHVFKGGKMGLFNEKTSKEITGMKYDKLDDYYVYRTLNYLTASINGKWGVLDLVGNIIIPFSYDEITDMEGENERLEKVSVSIGERSFKINREGKEIK